MEFWIARDKDYSTYLFTQKPERNTKNGCFVDGGRFYVIDEMLFPEVTWENSPQLVEIKLKDNGILDS